MDRYRLKTQNSPQEPLPKKGYVILPGHPLYGQEVSILQFGKTNTQVWCLISPLDQKNFRYRIPFRWLEDIPPKPLYKPAQPPSSIAFPVLALEKLVEFVNSFENLHITSTAPNLLLLSEETNQTGEEKSYARKQETPHQNLEKHTRDTKERSRDLSSFRSIVI